jgi:hypothetical protein
MLLCHLHIRRPKRITVAILRSNSQCSSGNRVEKNEMGGACGKYGGGERCILGFGGET